MVNIGSVAGIGVSGVIVQKAIAPPNGTLGDPMYQEWNETMYEEYEKYKDSVLMSRGELSLKAAAASADSLGEIKGGEGKQVEVTVHRLSGQYGTVSVGYRTEGTASAVAGAEFTQANGTLVFPSGATTATWNFTLREGTRYAVRCYLLSATH
jgi:hypothetical protein